MDPSKINEAINVSGLTVSDFAKKIGISRQAVYGLLKGANPSSGTLEKISKLSGLTMDYLLSSNDSTLPKYKNIFPLDPYIKLPIFGEIHAGTPINTDQGEIGEWEYADASYGDGEHFMLRVNGDSMAPTIPDGSIAIIRSQNYAEKKQVVAFALNGEYATLKRYYPQPDGSILLRGDNPEAESYLVTPEQLQNGEAHILGIVRSYKVNM